MIRISSLSTKVSQSELEKICKDCGPNPKIFRRSKYVYDVGYQVPLESLRQILKRWVPIIIPLFTLFIFVSRHNYHSYQSHILNMFIHMCENTHKKTYIWSRAYEHMTQHTACIYIYKYLYLCAYIHLCITSCTYAWTRFHTYMCSCCYTCHKCFSYFVSHMKGMYSHSWCPFFTS